MVVQAVIALAMVPFLLRHLGTEGYGFIGMLGVIVALSLVANMSLRNALAREMSEQVAKGDQRAFNELASTALGLYLVIAPFVGVLLFVVSPALVDVFKVSEAMRSEAISLLRWYGASTVFLSFVSPVFAAGLTSHHRFDIINTIATGISIGKNLILFVAISYCQDTFFAWAITSLCFQVLSVSVLFFCFRLYCRGSICVDCLNPSRLRSLFGLSGSLFLLQLTQSLSEKSDPLVISYFYGPSGVGLYQPGQRLSALTRPIVLTLANQMHPLTTKQHVDGNVKNMQRILVSGTKYTLLMGSLFSAGMVVFADTFARLWLEASIGQDYKIVSYVIMGWAIVDMTTYLAGTQWSVLLGMKKLKFVIWSQLPLAVVNVLVSIYFVGYTDFGIVGVLIATIAIGMVRRPLLIRYTSRTIDLPLGEYLKGSYLTPTLCFIVTLGFAYAIKGALSPTSYLMLVVSAGLTAAVWGVATFAVGLNATERSFFSGMVSKVMLRIKSRLA
jgi:O-antigen/teichoic acid export membrane protein